MICRNAKSWSRTPSRKRRFCHWKDVIWDIFWSFQGWGTWYQIFGTNISIDWISRKLDRASVSLHVQNSLCKSRQVDWTYRVLSARLSVLRARAESLVHGLPLAVTMQRLPCTFRQVCWTYRVYFARSGMLWCLPQKMLAPCKRSACELYRDHLLDPRSFFCLRKGQQILVECSPRPEVNVDAHSQNLDVQRLSIRSGLRGDPKYSSCVETKTH